MTGVLIRMPCEDTERGEDHVMMEAEIGARRLPVKECQGLPAVTVARREAWNGFFLSVQKELTLPMP